MFAATTLRGRGAVTNADGRFEPYVHEAADDGWDSPEGYAAATQTTVSVDAARTIIARKRFARHPVHGSPSIRIAAMGTARASTRYARPSHAHPACRRVSILKHVWLRSPLAARLLAGTAPPGLCGQPDCGWAAIPIRTSRSKRGLRITRRILRYWRRTNTRSPSSPKSALVERDFDLLAPWPKNLCAVFVSVTTLDSDLARRLEQPRAATHRRLRTIQVLAGAGIPTGVRCLHRRFRRSTTTRWKPCSIVAARADARHAGWTFAEPAIRNKGPSGNGSRPTLPAAPRM